MNAPPGRTHWPAVAAAVAAGAAIATQVGKLPVSVGALRAEAGLSLVQTGWVSSTLTTLAVLLALAVGLVAGRIGALRMVMGGLLLGAAASAAAALLVPALPPGRTAFLALVASRVLEGAGFLAVAVAAPGLVSAASRDADRRFALGLWATYLPLGAGLAMALSPPLLAAGGWRAMWGLAAAALLAAAAALWRQRAHYAGAAAGSHAAPAPPGATAAVLRNPLPWLYGLAFALWAVQHYALIVWMPSYLREQRGLGDAAAAWLSCAMLLSCAPGNVLGGWLLQRGWPRGGLIALAHLATGLTGWLCFNPALPDGLRLAASLALSFSGGLVPTAALGASAVLARHPRQIAVLQGVVMQVSQWGQFIGTPLVAAAVSAAGDWTAAGRVTGVAALGGIAVGLLAHGLEGRRRTGPRGG